MEEHWYKEAIIYELHVKCFYDSSGDGTGDFKGLTQKLDYLQDLGITAIWLLPFYPSPLKDDGYDIADYTDVHRLYGELKDFKQFLKEAHKRDLRVITELVINHTSDQHPWFQKARRAKKGTRARNFYVWNDNPDKYKDARIIFQDFEASNWTWDREAQSYFWHRFYSHQPDLNFDNPEVPKAIFRIMSFWFKMGVDGMRLDAVPYLYEREGTNCENLPETHVFLKNLRSHVDEHFSDRMLIAEANQWPEDASKYFGEGDECHMAFHFPVMPRLFMAIHLEDSLPIIDILGQTPHIPDICQWALFLRNHDELTLEMVTDEERDYMFRVYAHDPQARLNLGIRRRLAPLLKNDRRKIELMNSLLFSLAGTPVLYYGDELGMGDNIYLGDRNGVRTPMQWSNDRNAGFSRANPQQLYLPPIIDPEYHFETVNVEAQLNNPYSLLWWTKQLIALRKRYKAFSYGTTEFLAIENRKVLVFFREYQDEVLMMISNLSRFSQYVELDLKKFNGFNVIEMFSGERFPKIGELPYFLTLGPYGYYWFSLEKQPEESLLGLIERQREKHILEISIKGEGEKIFQPQMARDLESSVKKYLFKRTWFRPFISMLDKTKTKISDHITIKTNEHKIHLIVVEIVLATGIFHHIPLFLAYFEGETAVGKMEFAPESVVVKIKNSNSVSIVFDIGMDPLISETLLEMIHTQRRVRSPIGEIRGIKLPQVREAFSAVSFPPKEGNWITREEGCVIFPLENEVLKVFSYLEEGMHIDVEMRLFLMQNTDFRAFIPLLGYVHYIGPEKTTMALAEEMITHRAEYNAKPHAVEAAERFLIRMETRRETLREEQMCPKRTFIELTKQELDPELHQLLEDHPEVTRLLGNTTADFHLAMSSQEHEPTFAPINFTLFYQRSLYQTIRRKLDEGFRKLRKIQNVKEVEEVLGYQESIYRYFQILPHYKIEAQRCRYHGNYILENLHYTGKEFLIANFEGNPCYSYSERRYKRSLLLDVASMLFSFYEASFEAIDKVEKRGLLKSVADPKTISKWALSWAIWNGSSFLKAYLQKLGQPLFLPHNEKEIDFLLGLFLIERCMEKILETKTSNLKAPLTTLIHWLPVYEAFHLRS